MSGPAIGQTDVYLNRGVGVFQSPTERYELLISVMKGFCGDT